MAKRAGNLYEQRFFTEALSRGFEVFIPLGDYLPQDAIVMNSAGKLFKVQVKGTEKKDREGGFGRYSICSSSGRGARKPIDCTKVDVLVAYIGHEDVFYIIPSVLLDSAMRVSLYPHNPNSKAKHEKFKENWDIFKTTWVIYPPPCYNCNWCIISVRRITQECEL